MTTPATLHPNGYAQPSAQRMMAVIETLAADRFTGRRTGTPGGRAAAAWLATQLSDLGAQVTCDEFAVTGAVKELQHQPVLQWDNGTTTRELVHRREFAEHLASAYQPQPVTGPLQLFGRAEPTGAWLLDPTFTPEHAAQAANAGALGLITSRSTDEAGWMPKMVNGPATIALPVLSVREDLFAQMTAGANTATATVTASAPLKPVDVTAINVHATFATARPGAISVLLTAHYDGVGDDPGLRHPAACDNASGVAAVIETARILIAITPGIGIAVALLDAEEPGLHGAARHAPHVPQGTYVINLDGAAALDEPAAIEAGGPAHSLLLALDHAARQTAIPLQARAMRSDNRRYAQAGLATIGIGMGMPGYQTPAETPNRVQPHTLTAAVTLLLSTVDQLVQAAGIQIAEIDTTAVAESITRGGVTLVEALPEDVYAQGHLPGAVNIRPRRTAELAPQLLPGKTAPIVVYCGDATCDASPRVARYLTQLGYTNVRRYTGGKQAWTQAGLPLD